MKGLVITSENQADLKLVEELANRLGVSTKAIDNEELLDLGLLKAIEHGRQKKYVSKGKIIERLREK